MLAQAVAELPNECCGLLAGQMEQGVGHVTLQLPLVNAVASPREFTADPTSLLAADKAMRSAGVEMLAIYHSHPTSEAIPSKTDLARNYHGDNMMNLIISLKSSQPEVRAWWLTATDYLPAEWRSEPEH